MNQFKKKRVFKIGLRLYGGRDKKAKNSLL